MARRLLITSALVVVLLGAATLVEGMGNPPPAKPLPWEYNYHKDSAVWVGMPDLLRLQMSVTYPVRKHHDELFPLVVFTDSWSFHLGEYRTQLQQFSLNGYVCAEYTPRGWHGNDGVISAAGPVDRTDLFTVTSFLLDRADKYHINVSSVSLMGASLGGGIAAAGAAMDDRVKMAVSTSGWGNLTTSFFVNQSPCIMGIEVLVTLVRLDDGRAPTWLRNAARTTTNVQNHTAVRDMFYNGDYRCVTGVTYLLNERNVPLMYTTHFNDRVFDPSDHLNFLRQVTSPKLFIMYQGGHGMAEIMAMADPYDYKTHVWTTIHNWADAWLKGNTSSGVLDMPTYNFNYGIMMDSYFHTFNTWPAPNIQNQTLIVAPRAQSRYGTLRGTIDATWRSNPGGLKPKPQSSTKGPKPGPKDAAVVPTNTMAEGGVRLGEKFWRPTMMEETTMEEEKKSSKNHTKHKKHKTAEQQFQESTPDTIMYNEMNGLFPGLFGPTDFLTGIGANWLWDLNVVYTTKQIVYRSEWLNDTTVVCGVPVLQVRHRPYIDFGHGHIQHITHDWQLNAFLMNLDEDSTAGLITDGAYADYTVEYEIGPTGVVYDRSPNHDNETETVLVTGFELRATCQTVMAGRGLALAFLLYDYYWAPSQQSTGYREKFFYEGDTWIKVPILDPN